MFVYITKALEEIELISPMKFELNKVPLSTEYVRFEQIGLIKAITVGMVGLQYQDR